MYAAHVTCVSQVVNFAQKYRTGYSVSALWDFQEGEKAHLFEKYSEV